MDITPEWIRKKAAEEDNGIISVGGLISKIEKGSSMKAADFMFTIFQDKIGVTTKVRWNANKGYLLSDHEVHMESLRFLETVSPKFVSASECFFNFVDGGMKKNKKGARLLSEVGVQEAKLGEQV